MHTHKIHSADLQEAVNQFTVESQALLEEINRILLSLEGNTPESESIEKLIASFETIQHSAKEFELSQLELVSERFKQTLDHIKSLQAVMEQEQVSLLFKGTDLINELLGQVEKRTLNEIEIEGTLNALNVFSKPLSEKTTQDYTIESSKQPGKTNIDYTPSSLMIQEANKQLLDPDMKIVIEAFLTDSVEFFEDLDEDLPQIDASDDKHSLFSPLLEHISTVRSTSGFLSLEQISILARKIELLFEYLLEGRLEWKTEFEELLFISFCQLKTLLIQVQSGAISAVDYSTVLSILDETLKGDFDPSNLSTLQPGHTTLAFGVSTDDTNIQKSQAAPEAKEPEFYVGSDHPLYSEGMKEIVESFIVETGELFDELDIKLLDLEENYQNTALVDEIFRAVHTIKGSAGFLSLDQLNQLTHHFEDVLNRLRRGDLTFHSDMMDVMFEAFDLMKVLQKQVIDMQLEIVQTGPIVAQLKLISEGKFTGGAPAQSSPATKVTSAQATSSKPEAGSEKASKSSAASAKTQKQPAKRTPDRSTETIRVEVQRLDSLMNLVGELVLNRNRLVQIIDDVSHVLQDHDDLYRTMIDTSAQLDFITTELQTGVMHTRMVQVGRIFNKFPRVVRDLAKEANKKIELVIEGAETELDKSLTEEIGDPLVHLIRNSVDHGVESPEDRTSQGKSPEGRIRLSAQHEGNNIVIEIEDDGKGIDPEKVKKKAIEKGLISEKEAAEMSDKDAFNLIFKAGFSTAEKVTKISGRGVGMDVVKTNIAKMNGTISINSEMGCRHCNYTEAASHISD